MTITSNLHKELDKLNIAYEHGKILDTSETWFHTTDGREVCARSYDLTPDLLDVEIKDITLDKVIEIASLNHPDRTTIADLLRELCEQYDIIRSSGNPHADLDPLIEEFTEKITNS